MSITVKISADLMAAMKARDTLRLDALRAAKTAFTLARSETGAGSTLKEDEEIRILQRLVKQRRESAAIYSQNNRADLAGKESAEADILGEYLPARMSAEELTETLRAVIEKTGAKTPADTGKVMSAAMKELAGKADGKDIAAIVKQLLGP